MKSVCVLHHFLTDGLRTSPTLFVMQFSVLLGHAGYFVQLRQFIDYTVV